MKLYQCILFDLDHTLWDYESNSREALQELFHQYKLTDQGISSFPFFFETFCRINVRLWDLYDRGLIGQDVIREQRFHQVFFESGLDNRKLSLAFSAAYLKELPRKGNTMPHARETLEYLHRKYPLVVITNGFDEIQSTKMASAGIDHYFRHVITSQKAGAKKPSREIFDYSLNLAGARHADCIMIGDNLQTDIAGAKSAGIDAVYFNPSRQAHQEEVTLEISRLDELIRHL